MRRTRTGLRGPNGVWFQGSTELLIGCTSQARLRRVPLFSSHQYDVEAKGGLVLGKPICQEAWARGGVGLLKGYLLIEGGKAPVRDAIALLAVDERDGLLEELAADALSLMHLVDSHASKDKDAVFFAEPESAADVSILLGEKQDVVL